VITGAVLLAVTGWAFTFGLAWGNFWAKIGLTVAVVTAYAVAWRRPQIRVTPRALVDGVVSAAVLYVVFYAGHALAPLVVPGAHEQVGGIYGLGDGSSRLWVFLLLFFVTGPGEEIFWRGFLQEALQKRLSPLAGFALATGVYGGVHVFSGNLMLTLAALVAGAFWGALYLWRRDLASLILSHSVWSATIFAVLPIR
jgi:membrane protease YdiL (CAAX protease family)